MDANPPADVDLFAGGLKSTLFGVEKPASTVAFMRDVTVDSAGDVVVNAVNEALISAVTSNGRSRWLNHVRFG